MRKEELEKDSRREVNLKVGLASCLTDFGRWEEESVGFGPTVLYPTEEIDSDRHTLYQI